MLNKTLCINVNGEINIEMKFADFHNTKKVAKILTESLTSRLQGVEIKNIKITPRGDNKETI